ncbi:MAG: ElyC/SanA/YdcF family protein [Verrucomicrobiae bacterium]|nr:ElyC/SanA/YdcF family protein [Verrucomicrobiae bacterium]
MDAYFYFKKIALMLLMPGTVVFLLLLLVLAGFFLRQLKRIVLAGVVLTLILFLMAGSGYPARYVLNSLENTFPAVSEKNHQQLREIRALRPEFIVILGGAPGSRVLEALQLRTLFPKSSFIVTGGSKKGPGDAQRSSELLIRTGVSSPIHQIDTVFTTEEESVALKAYLGPHGNPHFLLVTDAAHMPRAYGLFKKQGLHPIAVPVRQQEGMASPPLPWLAWLPSAEGMRVTETAIRESVALVWLRLRGKI